MTAEQLAGYLRRIRLENNPARLAEIRAELDREHPTGKESDALVTMATLKRARLLRDN